MNFKELFNFLEDLQKNNNKLWMDENRKRYKAVRDDLIQWLDVLDQKLAYVDDTYTSTTGRKAINRINNNLMFQPDRPVYKDHFGAGLDKWDGGSQCDLYIHLGIEEVFIGSGYWHPDSKTLRSIREGIDYDGEELVAILKSKTFKKHFGTLMDEDRLTRPPRGYSKEHPHIELLKNKTYAAGITLSRKDVYAEGFLDKCAEIHIALLPFRRYLIKCVSGVEEY